MNLHDQMLADIDRVFLNLDEFACVHIFEGRPIPCIVDDGDKTAQSGAGGGFENQGALGVLQCDRLVRCRACDISPMPLSGSRVEMDNKFWIVGDGIGEAEGLVSLPLNRAY